MKLSNCQSHIPFDVKTRCQRQRKSVTTWRQNRRKKKTRWKVHRQISRKQQYLHLSILVFEYFVHTNNEKWWKMETKFSQLKRAFHRKKEEETQKKHEWMDFIFDENRKWQKMKRNYEKNHFMTYWCHCRVFALEASRHTLIYLKKIFATEIEMRGEYSTTKTRQFGYRLSKMRTTERAIKRALVVVLTNRRTNRNVIIFQISCDLLSIRVKGKRKPSITEATEKLDRKALNVINEVESKLTSSQFISSSSDFGASVFTVFAWIESWSNLRHWPKEILT